jgi:2-polyprenyl-3-methyl-5-hydroxy-6-metoxy-1,4-benzoquinol methylase
MDAKTLASYARDADAYAIEWHGQPTGTDLQTTVREYFRPGGRTADIGCGSGRDTSWLNANGFPSIGYDASPELLKTAQSRYPQIEFTVAVLPDLRSIADNAFDNVLCETVIMHLPADEIAASVRRLVAILKPSGTLYLSWRVTKDTDFRDGAGRLYAAYDATLVSDALDEAKILLSEERTSASSGKIIHRIVARKNQVTN